MDTNYRFFLRQFNRIKQAEQTYMKETEHIYYHQFWSVAPSLVYQLYLAQLVLGDDNAICDKKFELVARFLDNFAVWRSTNYRLFGANSIRHTMCKLTKTIRSKPVEELRQTLIQETETIGDFQVSLPEFRVHGQNKRAGLQLTSKKKAVWAITSSSTWRIPTTGHSRLNTSGATTLNGIPMSSAIPTSSTKRETASGT